MQRRIQECLDGREGSYVLPFLWMHGEPREALVRELDAIERSGAREFCAESRVYEAFCEDAWWEDFGFLLEEAARRGMRVWLLDDKHFPTGYANGLPARRPALQKRTLRECHVDVAGPLPGGAVPAWDRWNAQTERLIGIYAYRRAPGDGEAVCGAPVELTAQLRDGLVYWDIPDGVWRVFFLLDSDASPAPYRQYIDMLTRESCALLLEAVYQPHYEHFARYFGNTFAGFFSDEPCFANDDGRYTSGLGVPGICYPWKVSLPALLAEETGLSPTQVTAALPALWHDCGEITPRLRLAYMDVITRLYRDNFSRQIGDWCRAHGVEYIGHVIEDMGAHMRTGYGAGHYFRALDGQDMGGVDVVLGQIVPGLSEQMHTGIIAGGKIDPEFFTYALGKLAASRGHLQPRKRGRAVCEIFGAFGWAESLPMMCHLADHMLSRGVHWFVPHAFNPKFPDTDCPPYFYYQGQNPQYPLFGRLTRYMQRMSHALSGGVHQPDVAVLYNAEAEWAGGEMMPFQKPCRVLTRAQIDFDIVPADLLEAARADGGRLCIAQERFGALIVPHSDFLPIRVLERIAALAAAGVPVLFAGGLCARSAEGEEIRRLDAYFSAVPLEALPQALRRRGLAAVQTREACPSLRVWRTRREDGDVYMFFNESPCAAVDTAVQLPSRGAGVLYDAFDNTLSRVEAPDGWLPLYLPGGNACVVAFGGAASEGPLSPLPAALCPRRAPAAPLALRFSVSLRRAGEAAYQLWRRDAAPGNLAAPDAEPRFAGWARYETTLPVQAGEGRLLLDLGAVGDTAAVEVNGIACGVRLRPPYVFDVTHAARAGDNRLTVEVSTNRGYLERDGFSQYLPLAPMGLLGPVTLAWER